MQCDSVQLAHRTVLRATQTPSALSRTYHHFGQPQCQNERDLQLLPSGASDNGGHGTPF